jgi:hypothetical protein
MPFTKLVGETCEEARFEKSVQKFPGAADSDATENPRTNSYATNRVDCFAAMASLRAGTTTSPNPNTQTLII